MCVCGWLHDGLLLGGWELRCLSFGEWRPGCVDVVVASAAGFDGDNKHPEPELLPVHAFVRCSDDFFLRCGRVLANVKIGQIALLTSCRAWRSQQVAVRPSCTCH